MKRCALYLLVSAHCALLLFAGCGESSSDQGKEETPEFKSEIYSYVQPAEETGLAKSDFNTHAKVMGTLAIDPKFKYVMSFHMTPFMPPSRKALPSTGPYVFYADDRETIVFSPLDNFFTSLLTYENGTLNYGVNGKVDELPKDHKARFVMVKGSGINATVSEWGRLMREEYQRPIADRYADKGLSYIGYWTDNGAAYYYKTITGKNEQDTLLAVKAKADELKIPFGYFQIDSWWYFRDKGGGITRQYEGLIKWEPKPEMFPDGLASFNQKLGLPLVAHNRWFAIKNSYVEMCDFVSGKMMSLPLCRDVFDKFAADAKAWGVETYEQDWLMNQYLEVPYLHETIGAGEQWMSNMANAMKDKGLTMQICMPGALHMLEALKYPIITTSRTSVDYTPDLSKESFWPFFHTVNMFAYALGMQPFKDNFHSNEKFAEAEALISSLSAGMVGSGDSIDGLDAGVLMKTCMKNGLLLKPDKPALPIDAMFYEHNRPYTVVTTSTFEGLGTWTYLAAFNLNSTSDERTAEDRLFAGLAYDGEKTDEMVVWPATVDDYNIDLTGELGFKKTVVAYDWRAKQAKVVGGSYALPPIEHLYGHDYIVFAPILSNGIALIGETGKFVTMADKRIVGVKVNGSSLDITVAGVEGETVTMSAFDTKTNAMLTGSVVIDVTGKATLKITR